MCVFLLLCLSSEQQKSSRRIETSRDKPTIHKCIIGSEQQKSSRRIETLYQSPLTLDRRLVPNNKNPHGGLKLTLFHIQKEKGSVPNNKNPHGGLKLIFSTGKNIFQRGSEQQKSSRRIETKLLDVNTPIREMFRTTKILTED